MAPFALIGRCFFARPVALCAHIPSRALARGPARQKQQQKQHQKRRKFPSPLEGEPAATQAWPTFSPEPMPGVESFLRSGYRAGPARFESLGTLAAGRYCFCLCKKSNQKKHTLFVRRPLRGRSPGGGVCSGSWRGDIVSPRPSTGHPWPVAPCAHTPTRRPRKGTRKSHINIKTTTQTASKAPKVPSPLVGEGALQGAGEGCCP